MFECDSWNVLYGRETISIITSFNSPYSRSFQSEAATALFANKYFSIKLDRVSCTSYFMSIHNLRCRVQLIKIAKRDLKKSFKDEIEGKKTLLLAQMYDRNRILVMLPIMWLNIS